MTTAALEALHRHSPNAMIDIVADKRSSDIFSACPYRGEIIHKNKQAPFRGALALLRRLRRRYYDLIVDLRTDGLAYLCRGRRRFTRWQARPYGPHSVEQFVGAIRALHGEAPLPSPHLWLNADHLDYAERALLGLPSGAVLALGPASAAKEAQKTWPLENYARLANGLRKCFSAVILLGNAEDADITARLAERLSLPLIDTAGKTSLLEAAALLQKAALFVGSDSGLGHIAAAVKAPSLSLFSHAEPARYAPWGRHAHWIKDPHQDVRNIPVALVEQKARALVSANLRFAGFSVPASKAMK